MDHKSTNNHGYRWLEELEVVEVLAALTSVLTVLISFLNVG